ncbi:taste receptor type 2 member 42-like [Rhynchocyon petersi]
MPSATETMFLVLTAGTFIMGMLGNGFIGLVNGIDCVKNKKISLADCLLLSLAISRISFLWIALFDLFVILWPQIHATDKEIKFLTVSWILTNHLATWFATCLSIFYFFKIASFSHPCFAWLKRRLSRILLFLPLVSAILLLSNFPLADTVNVWMDTSAKHQTNITWSSGVSNIFDNLIIFYVTYLIPFLLSLTSLLLLFLSLVRHISYLRHNSMDTSDFNTEAHKRAMKMVISFLLLFIVHSSSNLTAHWLFFTLQKQEFTLSSGRAIPTPPVTSGVRHHRSAAKAARCSRESAGLLPEQLRHPPRTPPWRRL